MPDANILSINRSIRFIFMLNFAWSFLVIQAIMVPFYTSKGLSPQQIISIGTVFSMTLLLLDVPTGYLADIFSRRAALLGAGLFKGLGGTTLVLWQSYPGFILSFVLIGIGNSLFSGADLALLSHLNSAKGVRANSMSNLLSTRLSMGLLGAALSAILGGIIATHSFQTALVLNCLVAWTSFVIAMFIEEPQGENSKAKRSRPGLKQFAVSLVGSADHSLRLLFLSRIGLLAILQFHAAVLQILWQALKVPLAWFGILSAGHALLGAALAQFLTRRRIQFRFRVLIWLVASLPVAGFLGSALGSRSLLIGLGSGLLFEAYRALVGGRMNALFNEGLPDELIATGNSCASMGSRFVFVLISPGIGLGIQKLGVMSTFAFLGLAAAVFALIPLKLQPVSAKTRAPEQNAS